MDSNLTIPHFPYLLDHYLVIREIGRGGMGVVYEAKDQNSNAAVAIKMLKAQTAPDPNATARFYREIQACQALSHRNIIPIYDVGSKDGLPYYVMPLIQGSSLETLLSLQREKISIRLAVHIAFQIALALGHAHQRGVIHRDIKPSNIMITNEVVLLTDFGLARPEWVARMTATGNILGTPVYMSPEQVQGVPYLDGRSDIYSLGVCLYEMLTGNPPFQGNNLAEIFHQILEKNPTPPHQINPQIPESLSYITQKAMYKMPVDRYQSAEEMAEQLRRFLRDLPIAIRTTSRWGEYIKQTYTHWIAVGLFIGSLLLTLFCCIAWEKWQWQEQIQAYRERRVYPPPNVFYYVRPDVELPSPNNLPLPKSHRHGKRKFVDEKIPEALEIPVRPPILPSDPLKQTPFQENPSTNTSANSPPSTKLPDVAPTNAHPTSPPQPLKDTSTIPPNKR